MKLSNKLNIFYGHQPYYEMDGVSMETNDITYSNSTTCIYFSLDSLYLWILLSY